MSRNYEQIPCSIEKFYDTASLLGIDQKKQIEALGLGGLLQIRNIKMRRTLLQCLIQNYDPIQEKIKFGSGESFGLYPYDVEAIMGLHDKGILVGLNDNISSKEIPSVFKEGHTADGFLIDKLHIHLWDNKLSNDDFIRCFMLFALGTILAPVSTYRVPTCYYSLVKDVEQIKAINWNALTLGFLKENLVMTKEGSHSNKWPSGNLALLQVL